MKLYNTIYGKVNLRMLIFLMYLKTKRQIRKKITKQYD